LIFSRSHPGVKVHHVNLPGKLTKDIRPPWFLRIQVYLPGTLFFNQPTRQPPLCPLTRQPPFSYPLTRQSGCLWYSAKYTSFVDLPGNLCDHKIHLHRRLHQLFDKVTRQACSRKTKSAASYYLPGKLAPGKIKEQSSYLPGKHASTETNAENKI
jgi:hypothetical protein